MTARELIEKLQSAPEYLDCYIELLTDDGSNIHLLPASDVSFVPKQTPEGWTDKPEYVQISAYAKKK